MHLCAHLSGRSDCSDWRRRQNGDRLRSSPLIENLDFKGGIFLGCIRIVVSECRFGWKLLLEFWSSCAVRLQPRLATDLSGPSWNLPSTRKAEASLAKTFESRQDNKWLEIVFPMGRQELEPELSTPKLYPYPAIAVFIFFCPRGWTAALSFHSGWPCPGLLFHSAHWRPQNHHPNGRGCT